MSNLKQRLGRIAIGCSVALALFLGYLAWNDQQKINSYILVREEYLSLRKQAELTSQELGIVQNRRENYMIEFTEMRAHRVRPTEKQILERAEMNMHGQTPSIEQRFLVADYVHINNNLRAKELELRLKEAQLLNEIEMLEPAYLEALRTLRRTITYK